MKVAISGASGLVGQAISKNLDIEVTNLTRDILNDESKLLKALQGCDAIINLAGAPISKKWTTSYKKELYKSRINTTKNIVNALSKLDKKPDIFISTSAVGIYKDGFSGDEYNEEFGNDFLANLAKDWESEVLRAKTNLGIKTIIFRFGIVLSKNGGALAQMQTPFKLGLGGKIADGKNIMSWVHIQDLVTAIDWALNGKLKEDIYNLVSPNSLSNEEFSKELANVFKKPMIFTIPIFALKLKFAEGVAVLISSIDAKPKKLLESGFKFTYPTLKEAFSQIYKS